MEEEAAEQASLVALDRNAGALDLNLEDETKGRLYRLHDGQAACRRRGAGAD